MSGCDISGVMLPVNDDITIVQSVMQGKLWAHANILDCCLDRIANHRDSTGNPLRMGLGHTNFLQLPQISFLYTLESTDRTKGASHWGHGPELIRVAPVSLAFCYTL